MSHVEKKMGLAQSFPEVLCRRHASHGPLPLVLIEEAAEGFLRLNEISGWVENKSGVGQVNPSL